MGKRKTIREAAAVQISKLIDFKMFFKKTVRVPRGKLDFRRNKSIRQNQLKVQSTFQSSREKWTRKMPQPLAVTAFMASPRRFELPTPRLGVEKSISTGKSHSPCCLSCSNKIKGFELLFSSRALLVPPRC